MATTKETPAVAAAAAAAAAIVSADITQDTYKAVTGFIERMGAVQTIKPEHNFDDSFSNLIGGILKVISVERGKISCFLNVKAPVLNAYGGMHGGAVGSVAERVAIACGRTVVAENKDLFLGELGISYLSAAPKNADVIVDGYVVRSGRNVTVVAVDFRLKESGRLAYMARATFYNTPAASL